MDVAELGVEVTQTGDFVLRTFETVVTTTFCALLVLSLLVVDECEGSDDY
jgi:hypothetical protein